MESDFEREELEQLIRSNSSRITYVTTKKKKLFQKIYVDQKYSKYVKCTECVKLYIVKYESGSNGLIYHENKFHSKSSICKSSQLTLEHFVPCKLSKSEKEQVSRAAAVCSSKDLLPFCFVEGDGFKNLVNVIATICHSKKGKLNAKDLLPCAKTVSNNVIKIHGEMKEQLKQQLKLVGSIHATCDHWTEDMTNRSFFTVTVNYLPNDASTHTITSSVIATIETESKTAEQIKLDYEMIIGAKFFDISGKITSMTTDNATANIAAFKHKPNLEWYSCCAHNLNRVLKNSFDIGQTDSDYDKLVDIYLTIKGCKELVTYAKQSGLNSKLDKSLKQSVDTRWDSMLECLESVQESMDKLKEFSSTINKLKDHLVSIHPQLLTELIDLLIPFRTTREKLCKNSEPTFHDVAVVKQYLLMDHLKESKSNLSTINSMKERMRKLMIGKFPVTIDHMCASFLHPGLKGSFMKTYHDQQLVRDSRNYLQQMFKDCIVTTTEIEDCSPAKIAKEDDILASYYSKSALADRAELNEIEKYRMKIVTDEDRLGNPIKFWNDNTATFPKLSKISRNLLSIPSTSVKSEQNFSAAGRLINDRRTNLNSTTIDGILYLKSNL